MDVRRWTGVLLLLILLTGGCAGEYPRLEIVEPLPDTSQCRVAVLPFGYSGEFPRGAGIVTKAFSAELASVPGFGVVPEGDVLQFYRQFKLYPKDQPNQEQIGIMAQRLDAQYVIAGEILRIIETDAAGAVETSLTLILEIHGSADGKLLWNTYHKRNGQEYRHILHYGRVNSLSGLTRRMADEIIELWIENGMDQCAH